MPSCFAARSVVTESAKQESSQLLSTYRHMALDKKSLAGLLTQEYALLSGIIWGAQLISYGRRRSFQHACLSCALGTQSSACLRLMYFPTLARDAFKACEFHMLHQSRHVAVEKHGHSNGPVLALAAAIEALGWTWESPPTVTAVSGVTLDMGTVSHAMMMFFTSSRLATRGITLKRGIAMEHLPPPRRSKQLHSS
jgi:hypothetical protein